ncbi:hypothetical protein PYW07_017418 [Mythimna separata]|uniref:Uncharacterized protein n=1 Tax=Mythimna separata TaxID=271217 RepID=A0AAD7YYJ7_MYTSE|nr:hypothetical protein PYW07_017418 [Mythimna separata]
MASGDSSRKKKKRGPPPDAAPCPSRFVPPPVIGKVLPWAPRAGYDHEMHEDSPLVKSVMNMYPEGEDKKSCGQFLPLMQAKSWTKGVPHRDCYSHVRPSDSIGKYYQKSGLQDTSK